MTRTRIGVAVVAIVLAVTWLVWVMRAQAQPAGITTGRGNFRLTVGPNGVKCYKGSGKGASNHNQDCEVKKPTGTFVSATAVVILETSNTCWIVHNNVTYEVPCD
jgi:hypothetical protein